MSAEATQHLVKEEVLPNPSEKKRKSFMEPIMAFLFFLCGTVSILFVLLITGYMLYAGLPPILEIGVVDFLFGKDWAPTRSSDPQYGILPIILTSLLGTTGAVVLGVPVGLMMAVYLSKVAPPKIATLLRSAVALLAGIPSVVYGLLGMILLLPLVADVFNLSKGSGLFSAIIVLSIMILPSIISVSETALNAVPREYEEASLALGGSHLETIFKVSIPAARSGITAGVVLGVGRAIGESMAVMMVAGNVANMPKLFTSVSFLTTAVAKDMGYSSGFHREVLFAIALVLFFFILAINTVTNLFIKKRSEKR